MVSQVYFNECGRVVLLGSGGEAVQSLSGGGDLGVTWGCRHRTGHLRVYPPASRAPVLS